MEIFIFLISFYLFWISLKNYKLYITKEIIGSYCLCGIVTRFFFTSNEYLLALNVLAIAYIDYKCYQIPPYINIYLLCIGIYVYGIEYATIIAAICSSGMMYFTNLTYKDSFGMGDIKLFITISVYLKSGTFLVFFLSVILASVGAGVMMICKQNKDYIAFGPYITMSIIITLLFSSDILQWYYQFFM